MTFCQTLRNLIEERGITQKQLAHTLKIPVSTLEDMFREQASLTSKHSNFLTAYFNVSADYLLNLNVAKPEASGKRIAAHFPHS